MTSNKPSWVQPAPKFSNQELKAKEHVVFCAECKARMRLCVTDKFGKPRAFYGCSRYPKCKGVHGAHPDGAPLGVPADKATRAARMKAHAAFDQLWQGGDAGLNRGQAYALMKKELGLQHIGEMTSEQCQRVCDWADACFSLLDQPPREEQDDDH